MTEKFSFSNINRPITLGSKPKEPTTEKIVLKSDAPSTPPIGIKNTTPITIPSQLNPNPIAYKCNLFDFCGKTFSIHEHRTPEQCLMCMREYFSTQINEFVILFEAVSKIEVIPDEVKVEINARLKKIKTLRVVRVDENKNS
jgi:hypothetical protein